LSRTETRVLVPKIKKGYFALVSGIPDGSATRIRTEV
jgi:hypothetical protein